MELKDWTFGTLGLELSQEEEEEEEEAADMSLQD